MTIRIGLLLAASLVSLSACNSKGTDKLAENVEKAADNRADGDTRLAASKRPIRIVIIILPVGSAGTTGTGTFSFRYRNGDTCGVVSEYP